MLKVIGAGFGRTGTMSLKVALETLGLGPCYHMYEVFGKSGHVAMWQAAAEGRPIDWDALFADYDAAVDWPTCRFYATLLNRYPEAKVLLTVRDPEKWYASAMNTIYYTSSARSGDPERQAHLDMINAVVWDGTFDGRFEDKTHAISVFERHNEEVKQRVPSERLLVYEVGQGWEPLCRFLDVPVPVDTPFPRLNDTVSFNEGRQQRAAEAANPS